MLNAQALEFLRSFGEINNCVAVAQPHVVCRKKRAVRLLDVALGHLAHEHLREVLLDQSERVVDLIKHTDHIARMLCEVGLSDVLPTIATQA